MDDPLPSYEEARALDQKERIEEAHRKGIIKGIPIGFIACLVLIFFFQYLDAHR